MVPFLSAVAGAYGGAVVQRVTDQGADAAADATVGWGRRLLARLLGSPRGRQVGDAVTDLGENADDPAFTAAVYAQVKRALAEDAELAGQIAALVAEAPAEAAAGKYRVTVTGSTGVQVGDGNTQTINVSGLPG